MNFTRWSARLPGTQRRAAARTDTAVSPDRRGDSRGDTSVPTARAEQLTDDAPPVPAVDDLPVRDVLDRVPALVALVHGPDHRIAYVNDAYTAAFGVRTLGERAREALPELAELGLFPLLDQVQRSARPRTLKSRRAPDGRSYTFTCTPVTEDGDRGVLVFATDVTDHAEAAERLRASERRQRETAVTLQRSLLPQELEEPDDLRVAATYHPGGEQHGGRLSRHPQAQRPDRGQDQGGEQHRQRAAPDDGPPGERQHHQRGHGEDGEHETGRHGTQPPHLRHIDVQVGDGEAEPERAECVAHVDPAHRGAPRPGHVHLSHQLDMKT
ncbi:hypothetical protein SFUMM280S_02590 [Streptomyces fumanus]